MNYPPNMDKTKVDIPNTDDLCPECEEADLQVQHWWKNGKIVGDTGYLECPECNYQETI